MKLKSIVAGALLAAASFGASATTIYAPAVNGTSFTNQLIGTFHVASLSDITGSVFAAESINGSYTVPGVGVISYTLNLDSVNFVGANVPSLTDLDASAAGFSFHNVAAGDYNIFASGNLTANGQIHNLAVLGANVNVTAVPEPETYGMLLGGLALLGVVARRKANKAA